jgi:hypothetical protein
LSEFFLPAPAVFLQELFGGSIGDCGTGLWTSSLWKVPYPCGIAQYLQNRTIAHSALFQAPSVLGKSCSQTQIPLKLSWLVAWENQFACEFLNLKLLQCCSVLTSFSFMKTVSLELLSFPWGQEANHFDWLTVTILLSWLEFKRPRAPGYGLVDQFIFLSTKTIDTFHSPPSTPANL